MTGDKLVGHRFEKGEMKVQVQFDVAREFQLIGVDQNYFFGKEGAKLFPVQRAWTAVGANVFRGKKYFVAELEGWRRSGGLIGAYLGAE